MYQFPVLFFVKFDRKTATISKKGRMLIKCRQQQVEVLEGEVE